SADALQPVGDRTGIGALFRRGDDTATGKKCGKGRSVVVACPAVDVRPIDRFVLRIPEFDWLCRGVRHDRRFAAKTDKERQQTERPTPRRHRRYCPASVATTFQLGSREETSRANVHTSVTSVTLSALPSITVPLRSRVAEISFETKRTVICAVRPARSSA